MISQLAQVAYVGCIFELIMAFILLLISFNSYSIYKVINENKYKWFALSFFSIALAFVSKLIMNFMIYTNEFREVVSTVVISAFQNTSATYYLGYLVFFSSRILMLVGLTGIFLIITNSKEKKNWILLLYLAILTAYASTKISYIFNITAAVILGLIFLRFYQNYINKPKKGALGVALAFFTICLSYITFIFVSFDYSLFIAGEIIQLMGYLILLVVYLSILRK